MEPELSRVSLPILILRWIILCFLERILTFVVRDYLKGVCSLVCSALLNAHPHAASVCESVGRSIPPVA
jgi:hypothetical protein